MVRSDSDRVVTLRYQVMVTDTEIDLQRKGDEVVALLRLVEQRIAAG